MREFTLEEYKALIERLTKEYGRKPEQIEVAAACYELGATRAREE